MYWTEREVAGIHRSDLDGSNLQTLVEGYGHPGWNGITGIALDVAGGKMYWTEFISHGDYHFDVLARANLDGSNIEGLFGGTYTGDIALDLVRGKVYWTDSGAIVHTDLSHFDGADFHQDLIDEYVYIIPSGSSSIALDSDGGKIYWTNPGTQTIQRADLDGQNVEHFFNLDQLHLTGSLAGIALDLDGGKIYWTDAGPEHWSVQGTGTIQRADLDGQNREVLFDPIERRPHGIALGIDKMYWTDVVKGTIHQADLNGQNREVLVTGLDEPRGIALTAGSKIYWTDSGTGKIQAAGLDGSQVEDIVTGLDHPYTIALDRGKSKIYWTESDNSWAWRDTSQLFYSDLDGSHSENIATVSSANIALDEDRAKIYWTSGNSVFRANLDGSHSENIVTLDHRFSGHNEAIVLDPFGGKIYWTGLYQGYYPGQNYPSPQHSEIFRSNLDGSNVEQIHFVEIKRYAPTGIALYIPHPTSVSTPGTTPVVPTTSGLDPNFPNPFNASTQIAYRLATPGLVRLEIYNVLGQPMRTLVNQCHPTHRLLPSPLGRPRPAGRCGGGRRLSHPPAPPRRSTDAAIALPQVASRKRLLFLADLTRWGQAWWADSDLASGFYLLGYRACRVYCGIFSSSPSFSADS